jgi:hypothetical protein
VAGGPGGRRAVGERRFLVAVDPGRLVRTLAVIAALLTLAHLALVLVRTLTGHDYIYGLFPLFDLDLERNIPSFFSGCLLMLNALLFAVVAKAAPRSKTTWLALSGLFLFLAYDELFSIHEHFSRLRAALHTSGLLYYAWVIVYVPAVALLAWLFLPVWRRFDGPVRSWLARAAGAYLAGAVGVEMVTGAYHEAGGHQGDLTYGLLVAVEESLEMAGLIMLTHALLKLLQEEPAARSS